MIRRICTRPHLPSIFRPYWPHARYLTTTTQQHDPLQILFCGSDNFSSHSLRALHSLHQCSPQTIASIHVVCRPDKPRGRGLRTLHAVPIKSVASSLDLPLLHIDTFRDWSPPPHINLIVAVSFGLLVPPRILNAARYGGLNVHPSLLPDLRGPAPIQHAIMQARSHTGVTLQTMHPTKFDHGIVLDQTPAPGVAIPSDAGVTELVDRLGPMGADMLKRGIENGIFIHPQPLDTIEGERAGLMHAPKITTEDGRVDWYRWPAEKVLAYSRVFPLWDTTTYRACTGKEPLRVKFEGKWRKLDPHTISSDDMAYSRMGAPFLCQIQGEKGWKLAFETVDGQVLSPDAASIESREPGKGLQALVQGLQKAKQNSRL